MMSDGQAISVNFARDVPLFPLDAIVLLPQQVLPLHIFEPRYRQMIDHCLDGAGQIAMAVIDEAPRHALSPIASLRPAVCIGQIVQHEPLPDGRYNILLQGICRARIVRESPPAADRLYRAARLEPIGDANPDAAHLDALRSWIESELSQGPLRHLSLAEHVVEYVRDDSVPNAAVFELISFALLSDPGTRYRLLAEGDLDRRARILESELRDLASLITRSESQRPSEWPKGCSWN
jgi:Lon protease-like protein